jgi:hypothetical protein
MKYAAIAIVCLIGAGAAWAQEEEKPPEQAPEQPAEEGSGEGEESEKQPAPVIPVDPKKVIADLTLANAAKDVMRIDAAAKEALTWAKGAKDEETVEILAKELTDSIKAAKGNFGTLNAVVEASGSCAPRRA